MTSFVCSYHTMSPQVIQKTVRKLKQYPFSQKAYVYKILGDVTKLKILYVLSCHQQVNVCDISRMIEMSLSAVSHQLRKLKNMKLVVAHRSGRCMIYTITKHPVLSYLFTS